MNCLTTKAFFLTGSTLLENIFQYSVILVYFTKNGLQVLFALVVLLLVKNTKNIHR